MCVTGLTSAASAWAQAPFNSQGFVRKNFENCVNILDGTTAKGPVDSWNTLAKQMKGKNVDQLNAADSQAFNKQIYSILADCDSRIVYSVIEKAEVAPEKGGNPLGDIIMFVPNVIGGIFKGGRWVFGGGKEQVKMVAEAIEGMAKDTAAIQQAFGKDAKKIIHTLAPQIAAKILDATHGGVPDDWTGFRIAAETFVKEAVRYNIADYGLTPADQETLISKATSAMTGCLKWADGPTFKKVDERMKAGRNCVARFGASAEYRVADAMLDMQLGQKLGAYLSPDSTEKVKILARGVLAQCAAKVVTPQADSKKRQDGTKGCIYVATMGAFQLASSDGLSKTIADFSKAPDATMHFGNDQIKSIADRAQADFLNLPDRAGDLAACPGVKHSLIKVIHAGGTAQQFNLLKSCDPSKFPDILSHWMDDYSIVAGRQAVREGLRNHPQIKQFLEGKPLPKDVEDHIVSSGYDGCIARQQRSHQLIDPSACFNDVEASAKFELGEKTLVDTFTKRFNDAIAASNDKVSKDHFGKLRDDAINASHAAMNKCSKEQLANLYLLKKEQSINGAISLCVQAALAPFIDKFVEVQVIDSVQGKPDLKPYLPAKTEDLIKKLSDAGAFKTASTYATSCLLKGLDSFHLENLNLLMQAREPLCTFYVQQQVAYPVARILADGIANSTLPNADAKSKEFARAAILSAVNDYQQGHDTGGYNPMTENTAIAKGIDGNFGHGFTWHAKPEDELAAIKQIAADSKAETDKRMDGLDLAQTHMQLNLMKQAATAGVKDQLSQNLTTTEEKQYQIVLENDINKYIDAYVKDLKDTADRIHAKPKDPASQAAQKEYDRKYAQFQAAVTDTATQKLLTYKVGNTLRKAATEATTNAALKVLQDTYKTCVDRLRSNNAFDVKGVENCRNGALGNTIWTAFKLSLDENIGSFFPDLAKFKDKKVTDSDCRATNSASNFANSYTKFLCLEPRMKACVSNATIAGTKTDANSGDRITFCMSDYILQAAEMFTPVAMNDQLAGYFVLPPVHATSAEDAKNPALIWHDKMSVLGANLIKNMNLEKSIHDCMSHIRDDLNSGKLSRDAGQVVSNSNACVGYSIFDATNRAGTFAFLQFLFFSNPTLAQKSPAELQQIYDKLLAGDVSSLGTKDAGIIRDFHQCLDTQEKKLAGMTVKGSSVDSFRRALAAKNVTTDAIQKATAGCTDPIQEQIRNMVLNSLKTRGKATIAEAERTILNDDDRAQVYLRIKRGHDIMRSMAAMMSDGASGSAPTAPGSTSAFPAIPELSANLDQLSKVASDACLFDPHCESKLSMLHSQISIEKSTKHTVSDSVFKDKLLNSEVFDDVLMHAVQSSLRDTLEKQLFSASDMGGCVNAAKMVDFLTSYDYLKSRFLDKTSYDRNYNQVASGRYIVDYLKAKVKQQMQAKGSFDPNDPAFMAEATKLLTNYLNDDWEFNAAVFWGSAGGMVEDNQPGTLSYIGGVFNKEKDTDWWNKISHTTGGCKIMKSINTYLKLPATAVSPQQARLEKAYDDATKDMPGSTSRCFAMLKLLQSNPVPAVSGIDRKAIEAQYRSAVKWALIPGNAGKNPAQCLPAHVQPHLTAPTQTQKPANKAH